MITELSDEILSKDFSDEDIADFIRDYFGDFRTSSDEAIAHYIAVMRMDAALREDIFRLFHSAPLLCRECGRPSCIHGYPDD